MHVKIKTSIFTLHCKVCKEKVFLAILSLFHIPFDVWRKCKSGHGVSKLLRSMCEWKERLLHASVAAEAG